MKNFRECFKNFTLTLHLDRAVNFPMTGFSQPKRMEAECFPEWYEIILDNLMRKFAAATEALNGWTPHGSLHGLWQALDKLFLYFFMEMLRRERLTKELSPTAALLSELHCSPVKTQPEAGPEGPKIDDTFLSSDNEVLILCCFLLLLLLLFVCACVWGDFVTNCSYRKRACFLFQGSLPPLTSTRKNKASSLEIFKFK